MTVRRTRRRIGLSALVALTFVAAACSNAGDDSGGGSSTTAGGPVTTATSVDTKTNQPVSAPGVTSTEIKVASITSKTNPIGGDNFLLDTGIKAYFGKINSGGGMYGRQLKLAYERDDATGNNLSETEAMLSQDKPYAVFEAVELFTGAPKLEAAGIPTFGWNINAEWAGPKNFFPNIGPLCFEGCSSLGHFPAWLAKQVGAHRAAALGYNVPQSADAVKGVLGTFQKFGKNVDAQVVYSDDALTFGQTDYSAQVSQMKAKGVDILFTALDFNGDYSIAKEMKKQGILNKVTFVHPNLYNPDFVKKNADVLNGGIVLVPILAVEHGSPPPALQEYLDYFHEHNLKITELSEQGWFAARQFVEALKAAGPNFTWANLIGAWNQQTFFSNGGVVPPIDWTFQHNDPNKSVDNRSQFECANYVKIENGKFVGIYDDNGKKPYVCFNGKQPDTWQTPVNVSFAGAKPFNITDVQK
jgi:branched-chain amino acid transport system substrate-binding protein